MKSRIRLIRFGIRKIQRVDIHRINCFNFIWSLFHGAKYIVALNQISSLRFIQLGRLDQLGVRERDRE